MSRAIIIVIDALGIGALPDAAEYGDSPNCNTLANVAHAAGGMRLPHLAAMGLGNIINVPGVPPAESPTASYGRMAEASLGKDTTTGHWEIAGLVLEQPFQVYPNGFPAIFVDQFVRASGCGGILANCPASGTEIIERFHQRHIRSGHPIVYTSADSVFQVACNVETVSSESLYRWCRVARELLTDKYNVSRVIARPYQCLNGRLERIAAGRRDFAVPPPRPTVLDSVAATGGVVLGIGKIIDIFVGSGITHAVHTAGNSEGLARTLAAVRREIDLSQLRVQKAAPDSAERELIFVNLVDTDSLYGHRNDPQGYARALEEIDSFVPELLESLAEDDLLIITGDHGCDPTVPGFDHTREYVPLLVCNNDSPAVSLGTLPSFTWVARKVAQWLCLPETACGVA